MENQKPFSVNQEFIDKLFAQLYLDLEARTIVGGEGKPYNQLNMARLVRQLLLDNTGVLNLANREYRLQIQFIVPQIGPLLKGSKPILQHYQRHLPNIENYPPGYCLQTYSLDGYLGSVAMILADTKFSPRDVISYVANQFGGVHLAPYLSEHNDQTLARFNDSVKFEGGGIVLNCVNQISNTVLHALSPLMLTIKSKYVNLEF